MNISTAAESDASSLWLEDIRPVRKGSLPFKKRRFPQLDLLPGVSSDDDLKTSPTFPQPTREDTQEAASGAEGIAALSLLAAAASSDSPPTHSFGHDMHSDVAIGEQQPKKHGFSLTDTTMVKDKEITLSSALVAAAADLQSLHKSVCSPAASGTTEPSASTATSKSSSKAPLLSPLPNGCHGRTSRNYSYCRRQPCYNGSKYCKLHFQHFIVTGAATEKELSNGLVVELPDIIAEAVSSAESTGPQMIHQDKRYTGCATETRCKATTTRGRECAYCAVKDTKYCYLHADYDTNPPPRRGGAGMSAAANKSKESAAGSEKSGSVEGATKAAKGKAEGAKRKNTTAARRLSISKKEKQMADAPYPLLSTLATDKWLNRKVIVSTGPLTNHVGLVERWRNGWVTVRLPGVGLHNRRSFELYLHPNPEDGQLSDEKASTVVEVFDTSSGGKSSSVDADGMNRAEATGTPPTPMLPEKPVVSMGQQVHEVTPLVACRVIGIDQSARGGKRVSNIMFPTSMSSSAPDTVPESPVPPQPEALSFPFDDGVKRETTAGMAQNKSESIERKLKPPIRPTVSEDGGDIPLVESLLVAPKHKLGLLFGTAALERSRRSIYKPVRYEDKELMGKKSRKRDRDSQGDNSLDSTSSKRARSDGSHSSSSGSTPMISSSDEESFEPPRGMVSI